MLRNNGEVVRKQAKTTHKDNSSKVQILLPILNKESAK